MNVKRRLLCDWLCLHRYQIEMVSRTQCVFYCSRCGRYHSPHKMRVVWE